MRWIRLAFYLLGALGLAAVAFFTGIGKGKLGGRQAASRPDAGPRDTGAQRDSGVGRVPDTRPEGAAVRSGDPSPAPTPVPKRRRRLSPQVRQPEAPPSWDNWDMNLE